MNGLKHPATLIASLALFVALGSGAALASGLISGKKIVNHSIPEKKMTAAAIKALRGQQGPAGPKGATGATGPGGPPGPVGPSNAYSAFEPNGVALGTTSWTTATSLTLAAGSYILMAKTYIYATGTFGVTCKLTDSAAGDVDETTAGSASGQTDPLSLLAPLTSSGSTASVLCSSDTGPGVATAYNTHLLAIKVGSVSGS